jgi:hypothetical protein
MVTSFLRARIARKATERLDIEPACAMCGVAENGAPATYGDVIVET